MTPNDAKRAAFQSEPDTSHSDAEQGDETKQASHNWIEHPRTVQRLQILVVVLGIVLIAGFASVIAGIAYLALQPVQQVTSAAAVPPTQNAVPTGEVGSGIAAIHLPEGATIEQMAIGAGTLAIHYRNADGQGILIIDPASGHTKHRIPIAPAAR